MALQPIFYGIQWTFGRSLGGMEPDPGRGSILKAGRKLAYLNLRYSTDT
jgi:hypothetical protein